jgi:hypothetical protein
MGDVMGHAGMAATAVRYLRSVGALPAAEPLDPLPRPELRAVRPDERAPLDQGEFRRVLGNFASGVAVITAPGTDGDGPAGFACQSFASLSLDPPLVVFMVGRTSASWPRIARAGVFCANILGADQQELCRAFAVSGADKFAGVTCVDRLLDPRGAHRRRPSDRRRPGGGPGLRPREPWPAALPPGTLRELPPQVSDDHIRQAH